MAISKLYETRGKISLISYFSVGLEILSCTNTYLANVPFLWVMIDDLSIMGANMVRVLGRK